LAIVSRIPSLQPRFVANALGPDYTARHTGDFSGFGDGAVRRGAYFLLLVVVVATVSRGGNPNAIASEFASEHGTIEGTITYRADAKRPWRYARYYVKNATSGELAEAVVALRGKSLKKSRPAAPTTVKIDQKDFQFLPELVAIRQGDSVTFTNSDQATHNVRASGELANLNVTMSAGGAGNTIKFDRAGGIRRPLEIGCVFHSNMRAWIFVFDHPFYAVTKMDGKFRLAEVPAGEYELELSHPAGRMKSKKAITLKAGETLKVDLQLSPTDIR
jgi:plastocyanin